ncbi:hypothetical protein [Colwellia sp. UCD-KL20]|uniref:hypothetical protein n=1 Tax=Colwellia sp. UCD-KL20 TaxID=1917165 RepID=UPI000970DEB1|nr:hypothetical protein [Colwellia sp. UCD-KL20]
MIKIILSLFILSLSNIALAEEEPKPLPPLNPKYMGIHGMKLFNKGSSVYASHMLTLKAPNNVQIIYKIDINELSLLQLVKDADLVTIKPEAFNLERLMRGEQIEVNADVYMGNYKKDGMLTYKGMKIAFDKQLFVKVIDKPEESNKRQKYDIVQLRNNERILVHQIQQPPSYEHLIYLSDNVNCVTNFTASSSVPKENEIHYKLTYCGAMKPLYYNAEDFAQ